MIYLSILSFLATFLYLNLGLKGIRQDRKPYIFWIFLSINLSMAIWSFASGFLYLAGDRYQYSFWNKVGAFGWCSFEALVLYFILMLTGNKWIRNHLVKVLVLMPAPVFLFMVLFLFGPDINTSPVIEKLFYTGNFLYNFSYLVISMILLYLWGRRSNNKLRKKQADIIVLCSLVPFVLNLLVQNILPYFNIISLPAMGQLFIVIMSLGVDYAIMNYQFMSISETVITNKLFDELTGLTILINPEGHIIKANRYMDTLLHYTQEEIKGRHITELIKEQEFCGLIEDGEKLEHPVSLQEVAALSKDGQSIPFRLTIIPIRSRPQLLQGHLIIGEDIRTTKWLQEEVIKNKRINQEMAKLNDELRLMNEILINKSIKDGLTELYNHQYMNEILEETLKDINVTENKLCVMMLDIDHFKLVNDTFGHQAGDRVLVKVAELIRKNTRTSDYIGRYGGEEFIVVLPDTELEEAAEIAEKIRSSIQGYDFLLEDNEITISIGVVQYAGEVSHVLVNKADMLLYQAKSNGRNRVEV
ncbi:MAG TPA: diguanylate cyclase [Clostridiales bacterium]|nr:diguanylate cyclase [Clostridiales bacterium]